MKEKKEMKEKEVNAASNEIGVDGTTVSKGMRKKRASSRRSFLFINIILILGVFGLGFWQGTLHSKMYSQPNGVDMSVFWEAWNKLKDKSVENTDNQKMIEGAISGTLSSLGDPYTTYFTKEDNQRFREDIQGAFGGIGVEIVQKNDLPTVVAPLSDSPAEKAGIKAGDIIEEVDGVKSSTITFDETINKIRGAEGTKVKLGIIRGDTTEPLSFEIERQMIKVKSVEWRIDQVGGKKIGYIKIKQFGDDTESLFAQAAADMQKDKPDSIVLDLRNNPGGYLETAVNLASYFIPDGVIVSEKGKNGEAQDYKSTGGSILKDYKVTVLVNEGSASASEILTGAMKDRLGSKIVGKKTFGKGSVQELIDLSDGSAVKVTVAKWYTPNGSQINGEGIKPDVDVAEDDKTTVDEQLQKAEETALGN